MTITLFDYPGTKFDDQEAAVEELLFLVEQTGEPHGTVSARCKELEEGDELVRDEGLRKCPVSGRGVHMVRLAEEQLDMFGGEA